MITYQQVYQSERIIGIARVDSNLDEFWGEPTFNNIKIKPNTSRKEYTEGMLKRWGESF